MGITIEGLTFYNVHEVSEKLNVAPETIRTYVKQGRLVGQRIGRSIMVTEKSLLNFLDFDNTGRTIKGR